MAPLQQCAEEQQPADASARDELAVLPLGHEHAAVPEEASTAQPMSQVHKTSRPPAYWGP